MPRYKQAIFLWHDVGPFSRSRAEGPKNKFFDLFSGVGPGPPLEMEEEGGGGGRPPSSPPRGEEGGKEKEMSKVPPLRDQFQGDACANIIEILGLWR